MSALTDAFARDQFLKTGIIDPEFLQSRVMALANALDADHHAEWDDLSRFEHERIVKQLLRKGWMR